MLTLQATISPHTDACLPLSPRSRPLPTIRTLVVIHHRNSHAICCKVSQQVKPASATWCAAQPVACSK